jgi:hypothetical protein
MKAVLFISAFGNAYQIKFFLNECPTRDSLQTYFSHDLDLENSLYIKFEFESYDSHAHPLSISNFQKKISELAIKEDIYFIQRDALKAELNLVMQDLFENISEIQGALSAQLINVVTLIKFAKKIASSKKLEIEKRGKDLEECAINSEIRNLGHSFYKEAFNLLNWYYQFDRNENKLISIFKNTEKENGEKISYLYKAAFAKIEPKYFSNEFDVLLFLLISFGFESKEALLCLGIWRLERTKSHHLDRRYWGSFDIYYRFALESGWNLAQFLYYGNLKGYYKSTTERLIFSYHEYILGGAVSCEKSLQECVLETGQKIKVKVIPSAVTTFEQMRFEFGFEEKYPYLGRNQKRGFVSDEDIGLI